jgi:hypothetical protein
MAHGLPLEARWTQKISVSLCRSLLAAGVAAAILMLSPSAYDAHEPLKAMDLTWTETDANGFPLNPDWAGQAGRPHGTAERPDIDATVACDYFHKRGGRLAVEMCTTQPVEVDERRPFRGALPDLLAYACRFVVDPRERLDRSSVHGHINWQVATYTGTVSFDDFQDPRISPAHPKPGDGDLDFTLKRTDHRGYVAASSLLEDSGMVLEANRHELGALDSPWWKGFREAFERPGRSADARPLLHDAPAIAIGLLGIDTKHGAHTELHPLYALFARVSAAGVRPEHWVYFARDRGYEGACSMHQHFLRRTKIEVRIGDRPVIVPLPADGGATSGELSVPYS